MIEQKSHPGVRRQVHHWKWVHAEFGTKVYVCLTCKCRKVSKLNPGGWPSTVYTSAGGAKFERAPECEKTPDSVRDLAGA